ncbi:MAG: hypothetical protein WCX65_05660 [bacterium]
MAKTSSAALSKPKIAVQYILDEKKLTAVPGLAEFAAKVKKTIRSLGWDVKEFGPDINSDVISENCRNCAGQYAAVLGVTFTGTSARQTAVLGRFNGPVGVWYFPGQPWWGMASAASGIGCLRDEEEENPNIHVAAVYGDPEDAATIERLQRFARAAHTVFSMKREKIGLVGGAYYDVMPASNWHPDTMTSRLGPSYTEIDMSLLVRETKKVPEADAKALVKQLESAGMKVAKDAKSMKKILASARVSLALESLQKQWGLTGAAVNCYGGPDPEGYTGALGCCGASGCLKGHALGSLVIGCESDVIQTAQQMLFRHLLGVTPCMADPWKVDPLTGVLTAGTCGGPACLAASNKDVSIEAGALMSLYKVGVLGVCFPNIPEGDAIVARIAGRNLDKMYLAAGKFIGSDTTSMPGRLALHVRLADPDAFLSRGAVGNHFTFLSTNTLERDIARIELLCNFMGIKIIHC